MRTNKNEQDFVFRYFQTGKLDTRQALRNVKERVNGENREETQHSLSGIAIIAHSRRLRWIAVAASFLILVAAGAYTLLMPNTVVLEAQGQVAEYCLPDGSHVTLAPHSSLSYPEDNCREVEMTGCIYFRVKHDEQHPFDVVGEHGHVRVLGTQFMVDERTDAPEVMVTSGKVMFASRKATSGIFLTKGMRARLLPGADKPELLADYDANDVAWATHRLHFENAPLREVLDGLTKITGREYTASDYSKCLTGDFNTDSISQVLNVIEQTLDTSIR